MSILQEYEEIEKIIGAGRIKAISDYIKCCSDIGKDILYSDIVYKQKEYDLFSKWFEEIIKPFTIMKNDNNTFSVFLDQEDYWYDWVEEAKVEVIKYGDGHDYEDIFKDYLEKNINYLHERLKYDSENGMFCVYCNDIKDAEEVSYELSTLYKDENKMLSLIKNIKEKYEYDNNSIYKGV